MAVFPGDRMARIGIDHEAGQIRLGTNSKPEALLSAKIDNRDATVTARHHYLAAVAAQGEAPRLGRAVGIAAHYSSIVLPHREPAAFGDLCNAPSIGRDRDSFKRPSASPW